MGSYKKKLFIVLLLILLLNFFVCSSVNAVEPHYQDFSTYNVEVVNFLEFSQQVYATLFFNRFNALANDTQKAELKQYLKNWSYYFSYINNNSGVIAYSINFYPKDTSFYELDNQEIDTSFSYFNDEYTTIPMTGYNFPTSEYNFRCFISGNTLTMNQTITWSWFLPVFLIHYQNPVVVNYINDIDPNMSPWTMLQNAINDNTDAVEDTTQAVNNLRNDFNEEESSTDYDFPTDNPTTDPTTNGIDTIFNLFYSRINNWEANIINVPIPFTNKSFSISPTITEDIVDGFAQTTQISRSFKYLLGLVWYYLLGRYVVKDVQKYVDGLQTGEILTKSDTNIKTEML